MSSGTKKTTLKLPRLKTKDELLKSSPNLFSKLLADDLGSARSSSPHYGASKPPPKPAGPLSATRKIHSAGLMDTPRFEEMEITDDMLIEKELDSVKKEQLKLKAQLLKIKEEAAKNGGEAQQHYIKHMMSSLQDRKAHLNKLRADIRAREDRIKKLKDADEDCLRLTPGGLEQEQKYIAELKQEMKRVEEELAEAEAKNRLYFLLGERTRREHLASDMRVRAAQETKKACLEDLATLAAHHNEKRQEREAAEHEHAKLKQMLEETKMDNQKKIRARRREVHELQRRQQADYVREKERKDKVNEEERERRKKEEALKLQYEAHQQQVAALAPQIDALEAVWNRVRIISGADTPEGVVAYWNNMKAKHQAMQDLVKLAEARERAAKEEIANLMPQKATIFVDHQEQEEVLQQDQTAADDGGDPTQSVPSSPTARPFSATKPPSAVSIESKRAEALRTKYGKLRSVCISAEQGLQALLLRLQLALHEVTPDSPAAVGASKTAGGETRRKESTAAASASSPGAIPRDIRSPGTGTRNGGRGSENGSVGRSGSGTRKQSLTHGSTHVNASGRVSPGALQTQFETASEGAGSAEEAAGTTGLIGTLRSGSGGEDDGSLPNLNDMLAAIGERMDKLADEAAVGHAAEEGTLADSERALMRGLLRRTWTGAPWFDSLTSPTTRTMDLRLPTMRRQKGNKKKELPLAPPDLTRIMGYNFDAPAAADAGASSDDGGGSDAEDGVQTREQIKQKAEKMLHRHHQKLSLPGRGE